MLISQGKNANTPLHIYFVSATPVEFPHLNSEADENPAQGIHCEFAAMAQG